MEILYNLIAPYIFYFLLFIVALVLLLSAALSRLQAITLPLVELSVFAVIIGWILT